MTGSMPVRSILIVGGGTAGWLTAAILANNKHSGSATALSITLIEAPDIPTIGVGEGTWPSMRSTLHNAGILESDFLQYCHASFKQGSKFVGWKSGDPNDYYYHPFELPQAFYETNLAQYWIDSNSATSFSKATCVQEYLCEQDLSPKLRTSGEYKGVSNYGYHLDAGRFSEFLTRHCVEKLGVKLLQDKVVGVVNRDDGYIDHVQTEASGAIKADLFVDCSGFRSLLLGQHYGIEFRDKIDILPINSALAVQVPGERDDPIRSATVATAQEAGWIWDIGLSNRRGVGHVYSDNHLSSDRAADQLQRYLNLSESAFHKLNPRSISIRPGYREKFWHKNCVAIGLSAGFLEPLEASAMMLIEASANMIANQMPSTRDAMDIIARRFNKRVHYRWERIIDFLKLHYVLSERPQSFWRDVSLASTMSDRLKEDLALWRQQAPWKAEFDSLEEAFPAASYQYVLYGMQFKTRENTQSKSSMASKYSSRAIATVSSSAHLLLSKVESNRNILNLIHSA